RILAEGAEAERLAVPRPGAERGLRHRPGREAEGDREPADLGAHVRRRAVVAGRVLGVTGDDGVARRARRALVRAAVALAGRRVADRARLDTRVVRAHTARTVAARHARDDCQAAHRSGTA